MAEKKAAKGNKKGEDKETTATTDTGTDGKTSVTVEVDPADLGVTSRHHHRMANDEEYRNRALTPPGGFGPGEEGKAESPLPEGHGLPANVLADAAASTSE